MSIRRCRQWAALPRHEKAPRLNLVGRLPSGDTLKRSEQLLGAGSEFPGRSPYYDESAPPTTYDTGGSACHMISSTASVGKHHEAARPEAKPKLVSSASLKKRRRD